MKTSTRVKTINGNEYLYEITYYYDKEAKRTRQKSKYLGKNVNGTPVRVREQSRSPKAVYCLGEFLPYRQACLELDLEVLLRAYFNASEIKIILAIVYSGLTNLNALYNPSGWYEDTAMHLRSPSLKFTQQTVTKLLQKIGGSQIPFLFCQDLFRSLSSTHTAVYDINIDTGFTNMNSELYNDSTTSLDPEYENITIIYDAHTNLPVFYLPHSQPVPGTSSWKEVLAVFDSLGLDAKNALFVQNRNGYTPLNLYELHNSDTAYILPISMSVPEISEFEKENQTLLLHPKNLNIYNNSSIFVLPFNITLGGNPVKGYLYYSPQKDDTEQKRIFEHVRQVCVLLDQLPAYPGMNPASIVKEIAGPYEPFIGWRVEDGKLDVFLKAKTISKHIKRLGRFAILYSGVELKWDECLSYYDSHAADKRLMIQLAERKRAFPYGTHTQDVTQGILFVSYLSLLLRRWTVNRMKEVGLLNMYTPEKVLSELEKIRLIEYTNHKITFTDLNGKQKEFLASMKIALEY